MGGFTLVRLKDKSESNIAKHNAKLKAFGVPKKYKFYSELDTRKEYEYYKLGDGHYPESHFPKDKINSYNDFKKYWNPKALGEVFVPHFGTLTFDCYFGRTSQRAMHNIGKYIAENHNDIEKCEGSFETFMERGMTKLERQIITESNIKY